MPKPAPNQPNPVDIVRTSTKFLHWKPSSLSLRELEESDIVMEEQHYTPSDLAKIWGVSVQTIRELFKQEEGVLKIGSAGARNRRAYQTLRIPHSVAERVHTRLFA